MDFEHIFKIVLTKHVKSFDSRETLMTQAFSQTQYGIRTQHAVIGEI